MSCAIASCAPSRAVFRRPSSRAGRSQRAAPVCAQHEQASAAATDRRSLLLGLAGAWFRCCAHSLTGNCD